MAAIVIPVNDVVEGNALLHGEEEVAFGDAGFWGADKRADPVDALAHKVEYLKPSVRAKGAHSVRAIKRQFRYVQVRYRGRKKNTA